MKVQIQCPNPACSKTSAVPSETIGRTITCRACGQSFVVCPTAGGTARHTAQDRTVVPKPAESPTAVGRFVIRKRLGAGAFGTVYLAYDPQLEREVALKVPNPGVLNNPKRIERFMRAARAAAGLRH